MILFLGFQHEYLMKMIVLLTFFHVLAYTPTRESWFLRLITTTINSLRSNVSISFGIMKSVVCVVTGES